MSLVQAACYIQLKDSARGRYQSDIPSRLAYKGPEADVQNSVLVFRMHPAPQCLSERRALNYFRFYTKGSELNLHINNRQKDGRYILDHPCHKNLCCRFAAYTVFVQLQNPVLYFVNGYSP